MALEKPQLLKTLKGRVREFRISDYEQVVSLWETVGLAERSESSKAVLEDQQKVASDLFLVYEIDGRITGTVIGGWDGWRAWIYRIAVDPRHHRKGVGSSLISEIVKRLESKGSKRFRALILAENAASKSLFKSVGFKLHENIVLATRDSDCC